MSRSDRDRIEIEFDEPCEQQLSRAKRPEGELEGTAYPGAVKIYIENRVMNAAWRHIRTNPRTEIGGVLVGKCADDNGIFTHIFDSLEARHTTTSVGSLTFTHETWADIAERMNSLHPDAKIAGWYHSHPGHGIFLSGKDLFIHNNFFRNEWQCALVMDPIRNDEGLFQSVDGHIVQTGYWRVGGRTSIHKVNMSPPMVVDLPQEQNSLNEAGDHLNEAMDHINDALDKVGEYAIGKVIRYRSPLGRYFDKKA